MSIGNYMGRYLDLKKELSNRLGYLNIAYGEMGNLQVARRGAFPGNASDLDERIRAWASLIDDLNKRLFAAHDEKQKFLWEARTNHQGLVKNILTRIP